jgi:O-antigen ligase
VIFETVLRGALATLALLLVLPLLLRRLSSASTGTRALTGMTFYTAAAVVSVAYSVAPFSTAGKAYELVVALAIVWTMFLNPERKRVVRDAVEWLVLFGALEVGIAVVGFFLVPDLFSEVQSRTPFIGTATMVSPYSHSNGLSAEGALVSAYALASWLGARTPFVSSTSVSIPTGVWRVMFLIGTTATVLASARQGLIIWLLSIAVVLWVFRRALLVFAVPLVAILVMEYWDPIWEAVSRNQQQVTLATWSGRLIYWDVAVDAWADHPWTGYGFGAGGRFVALRQLGKASISSIHSGYFEALIGVGLLGLIPLGYAIWRVVRWTLRQLWQKADVSAGMLAVPLLLHASVSLGFAGWVTPSVLIFMLLAALSDIEHADADVESIEELQVADTFGSLPAANGSV